MQQYEALLFSDTPVDDDANTPSRLLLESEGRVGVAPMGAQSSHERAHCPFPGPSGELIHDPDFALPTLAGAVPWRLFHYSCKPDVVGPFGRGRRASWPLRLCVDQDPPMGSVLTVTLEREDGFGVRYRSENGGTTYTPVTPRVFDTLTGNPSSGFEEVRLDTGTTFRFLPGHVTSLSYYETVHGQRVTFTYDAQERLSAVQAPQSQGFQYVYDPGDGLVHQVIDTTGRIHTLTYNGQLLTAIQDPGGHITGFGYDSTSRLSYIEDPLGNRTSYTYDADGRVNTRALGTDLVTYSYGTAPSGADRIASQDVFGNIWAVDRDADGNIIRVQDPVGAVRAAVYDGHGLPLVLTDAVGRLTTLSYDERGRETERTEPLEGTFLRTYDKYGSLLTETDPLGYVTSYAYNIIETPREAAEAERQKRLLRRETDPLGYVTTFNYLPWGGLEKVTSPLGHVTTFAYDTYGQTTREVNPLGGQRSYSYDARGNLLVERDEAGRATTYTYDALGNQTRSVNMTGAVRTTTYDGVGNTIAQVDPLGHITTHQYTAFGAVLSTTNPDGQRNTTTYDAKGRKWSIVDPLGHRTTYHYDAADRRIAEQDAVGRRTTTAYDLARRPIAVTDPGNATFTIAYDGSDAAGRTIAHIDPFGHRSTSVYDPKGRLIVEVSSDGLRSTTVYDPLDRVRAAIEPSGARTTTVYDSEGRAIRSEDPFGGVSQSFYDAVGNLTGVLDPVGQRYTTQYSVAGEVLKEWAPDGRVTTYSYDVLGRQNAVIDPYGYGTALLFDAADRIVTLVNEYGQSSGVRYDARNRPVLHVDEYGNRFTTAYDAAGRQTEYVTPFNRVTTWYDATDAFTLHLTGLDQSEQYFYAPSGYQSAVRTPSLARTTVVYDRGRAAARVTADGVPTTFTYDGMGRHAGFQNVDGSRTTFLFDTAGRLNGLQDEAGYSTRLLTDESNRRQVLVDALGQRTTYQYDYLGRTVEVTNPRGFIATTLYYDQWRTVASIDALGNRTTAYYDWYDRVWDLDRPRAVDSARGLRTTYHYDSYGRWSAQEIPSGARTTTAYDPYGRFQVLQDASGYLTTTLYQGRQPIAIVDPLGYRTTYLFDALGRQVGRLDALGRWIYDIRDINDLVRVSVDGMGRRTTFDYDDMGRHTGTLDPLGRRTTFVHDARGRLVATRDARGYLTTYAYDVRGLRTGEITPRGYRTTASYDALRRPTLVTDPLGYETRMGYNPVGSLESVVDALGNRTTRLYNGLEQTYAALDALGRRTTQLFDPEGRLSAVQNPLGYWTQFAYDRVGDLAAVRDPLGAATTFVYDGERRRVAVVNALGYRTTTVYDPADRPAAAIDPLGWRTTTSFDPVGRPIVQKNRLGYATTLGYDLADQPVATTDALGRTTLFRYDAAGQLVEMQDPLGYVRTTTYDPVGNVLWTIDPLGRTTQRFYDPNSNLERVRSPRGLTTTYVYDADDRRTVVVDPLGYRTTTTYDALDRPTAVQNALGQITQVAYTPTGQPAVQIDALGFRTTTTYDALDRPIAVQNALGYRTTTAYDAVGQPILTTDPLGYQEAVQYDLLRRVTQRTNARGFVWTATYDARGSLLSTRDPLGYRYSYVYDPEERRIVAVNPLGARWTSSYDAVDLQVASIDPLGYRSTYRYDALRRRISLEDALGRRTTTSYDAAGQVISVQDGAGFLTNVTFDEDGSVRAIADPRGYVTTFEYDRRSSRVVAVDPLGHRTTTAYDALARPAALQDAIGNVTGLSYTSVGMLAALTDALGYRTTYHYDALRRRTAVEDALGYRTTTAYDAADRPVALRNALGYVTTSVFDPADNRLAVINPLGYATTTSYDALDRAASRIDPLRRLFTWTYDAAGRMTKKTDAKGQITTYVYNARDEEISRLYSDALATLPGNVADSVTYAGRAGRLSLTYDGAGQLLAVADYTGRYTYAYDAAGRLLAANAPGHPSGQPLTYTYDGSGNRIKMASWWGSFTYAYDPRNLLIRVDDPGYAAEGVPAGTTEFAYDRRGRLALQENADGSETSLTYDAVGRISQVGHRWFDTSLSSWEERQIAYTRDPLGRPTGTVGELSGIGYDALGRVISQYFPIPSPPPPGVGPGSRSILYDAVDRRTVVSTTYFNQSNTSTRIEEFTHDAADQVVGWVVRSANRILSIPVIPPLTTIQHATFTYDANGNRNRTDISGDNAGVTTYTWDAADRLRNIIMPGAANPGRTNVYRWDGLRLVSRGEVDAAALAQPLPGWADDIATWDTGSVAPGDATAAAQPLALQRLYGSAAGLPTSTPAEDATTSGSWVGEYGADGYVIAQLSGGTSLPSYSPQVTITGASNFTWAATTSDTRALTKPGGGSGRIAACWHTTNNTNTPYTIDFAFTDRKPHRVALYCLDWANEGRVQDIVARDLDTGVELTRATVSDFSNGKWLRLYISGRVRLEVYRVTGVNAVISGIFLDGVGAPVPERRLFVHAPSNTGIALADQTAAGSVSGSAAAGAAPAGRLLRSTGNSPAEDGTPTSRHYHLDALGSVVSSSGEGTQTTGTRDPWGQVIGGSASAAGDPFGFVGGSGYWYEPNAGLYYVRARWLDPVTGEWLSTDSVESEPRYTYVRNAPTYRTDPSGTAPIGLSPTGMPPIGLTPAGTAPIDWARGALNWAARQFGYRNASGAVDDLYARGRRFVQTARREVERRAKEFVENTRLVVEDLASRTPIGPYSTVLSPATVGAGIGNGVQRPFRVNTTMSIPGGGIVTRYPLPGTSAPTDYARQFLNFVSNKVQEVAEVVGVAGRKLLHVVADPLRAIVIDPLTSIGEAVSLGWKQVFEKACTAYAYGAEALKKSWQTLERVLRSTHANWEYFRKALSPVLENVAPPPLSDVSGFSDYQIGLLWGAVQGLFGLIPVVSTISDVVNFLGFFFDRIGSTGFWQVICEYLKAQWDGFVGMFTRELGLTPRQRGELFGGVLVSVIVSIVGVLAALFTGGASLQFTAAGILRALRAAGKMAVQNAKSQLRHNVSLVRQASRGVRSVLAHGLPKVVEGAEGLLRKPIFRDWEGELSGVIQSIAHGIGPKRKANGNAGKKAETVASQPSVPIESPGAVNSISRSKPNPRAHSLSAVIDIPNGPEWQSVREGLAAIDRTHGYPSVSVKIPVLWDDTIPGLGQIRLRREKPQLSIAMHPAPHHRFDQKHIFVHEVGHGVDITWAAMRKKAGYLSEADDPEILAPLMEAIRGSEKVKEIEALHMEASRGKTLIIDGRREVSSEDLLQHTEYYLRGRELFARAYTQFVARRGGDRDLEVWADSMATMQHALSRLEQWSDHDFAPIATEFDKLFLELKYNVL